MNLDRRKVVTLLTILVWIGFLVVAGLMYYANHYAPKGPLVSTGDVACEYENRGSCSEEFIEDTRNLNIPGWVVFFKKSEGYLLLMGLAFLGVVLPGLREKSDAQ